MSNQDFPNQKPLPRLRYKQEPPLETPPEPNDGIASALYCIALAIVLAVVFLATLTVTVSIS